MSRLRRTAVTLVALTLALTLGGCGNDASSPSSADDPASSAPLSSAGANTTATDLSPIACATNDPDGVGDLTARLEQGITAG